MILNIEMSDIVGFEVVRSCKHDHSSPCHTCHEIFTAHILFIDSFPYFSCKPGKYLIQVRREIEEQKKKCGAESKLLELTVSGS